MAYRDFEDLPRRATSDQVLCDKAFTIANDPNVMSMKVELLQLFINLNFLIKKSQRNMKLLNV